jgi:DNA-binding transcriptional ArsR family regulator
MPADARPRLTADELGLVFGALSDPTRRGMLETLMRDGSGSVPSLTATLPITRQGVAKHLTALENAGLIERLEPGGGNGREIRYRPRPDTLVPATEWLAQAGAAWDERLAALKATLEASDPGRTEVRPERVPELRRLASGNKEL